MLMSDLRYFALSELKHPELDSPDFWAWLDRVRELYGFPLVVTSDGRTAAENAAAPNSSPTSRHLFGEAADFEFPPSMNHLFLLVDAVMHAETDRPIELEIVHDQNAHVHVAWLPMGRASSLIVRVG